MQARSWGRKEWGSGGRAEWERKKWREEKTNIEH